MLSNRLKTLLRHVRPTVLPLHSTILSFSTTSYQKAMVNLDQVNQLWNQCKQFVLDNNSSSISIPSPMLEQFKDPKNKVTTAFFESSTSLSLQMIDLYLSLQTQEQKLRFFSLWSQYFVIPLIPMLQSIIRLPPPTEGLKFVIDLRADLLSILSSLEKNHPLQQTLSQLDAQIEEFLSQWFTHAFLQCKPLDWSKTSANICEKIIQYEKVHLFQNWSDLKLRMGTGGGFHRRRRMYCLEHDMIPNEPICFIQVALTKGIAHSMKQIFLSSSVPAFLSDTQCTQLQQDKLKEGPIDTAVFYSVVSTQRGLSGIDLAKMLIQRVVQSLRQEQDSITNFVTLSPIPNFKQWLYNKLLYNQQQHTTFFDASLVTTQEMSLSHNLVTNYRLPPSQNEYQTIQTVLDYFISHPTHSELREELKPFLMRLVTRYLVKEKRRGKCLDPVSNFHVRNGATMHRINYHADESAIRMKESFGIMINYRYYVLENQVEQNAFEYAVENKVKVEFV